MERVLRHQRIVNKKINCFPRVCRALLVFLGLMPGLSAWAGDDTNRFPYPLFAEDFVQTHLTNQDFIDLAGQPTGRIIRGGFLEWLLTKKMSQLSHHGLRLKNAVITNAVDLSNVEVPAQVHFCCCHFLDRVNLSAAHFGHDLTFEGCLFDGEFQASALRVGGSLELKPFYLSSAWETDSATAPPDEAGLRRHLATNETIQSWSPGQTNFILDTNRLIRKWMIADARMLMIADPTNVNLTLTNRWTNIFEATAWGDRLFLVQINDEVPGQAANAVMNLTAGPFTNQWNTGSLELSAIRTALAVNLNTSPADIQDRVLTDQAASPTVSVRWWFDNPTDPAALPLVAKWARGSPLEFCQPTVFRQPVSLDRAVIAGKLDAPAVAFRKLWCHSLKVENVIWMADCACDDEADFTYSQIGRDFWLHNCLFKKSFKAVGMNVGGSLILEHARFGDKAEFDDVTVGHDFRAPFVRFENRNSLAEFRGLKVDGQVAFKRAQFAGPANFILSHIKGNFQAEDATFEDNHPFRELQAITADSFTFNVDFGSMQVDGFAIFEDALFTRSVSFRNARFGNLYLDGMHWPEARRLAGYTNDPAPNELLRLEGMDFDTIRDITTSGRFRHTPEQLKESQKNLLEMFARRSPYSFDIYAKLEKYFVREGAPDLADQVHITAKKREGKEAETTLARVGNWILQFTVGYGRMPWRTFGESLVIILIWGFFYYLGGCMVRKIPEKKDERPGFWLALLVSLGTFLPIIDLGTSKLLECKPDKEWFRYVIAAEKILGYILVPLWTMALTGLIK